MSHGREWISDAADQEIYTFIAEELALDIYDGVNSTRFLGQIRGLSGHAAAAACAAW
jgi:hypothetical protein